MKRKIGELRNIPIVEGDKNLVREGTEIHINDLQSKGGSDGGGLSTDNFLYIKSSARVIDQGGAPLYYPFYRALGKYYRDTVTGMTSLKQAYFNFNNEDGLGVQAAEIFKVKDLLMVDNDNNMVVQLNTTSYDSLVESYVNAFLTLFPEVSKEEMITSLKVIW